MPSTSKKQEAFMRAAAHNREFARKAGIPQSVAKEYNAEDKRAGMIVRAAARRKKGGKP